MVDTIAALVRKQLPKDVVASCQICVDTFLAHFAHYLP